MHPNSTLKLAVIETWRRAEVHRCTATYPEGSKKYLVSLETVNSPSTNGTYVKRGEQYYQQ